MSGHGHDKKLKNKWIINAVTEESFKIGMCRIREPHVELTDMIEIPKENSGMKHDGNDCPYEEDIKQSREDRVRIAEAIVGIKSACETIAEVKDAVNKLFVGNGDSVVSKVYKVEEGLCRLTEMMYQSSENRNREIDSIRSSIIENDGNINKKVDNELQLIDRKNEKHLNWIWGIFIAVAGVLCSVEFWIVLTILKHVTGNVLGG
jgi:hypothetical protein